MRLGRRYALGAISAVVAASALTGVAMSAGSSDPAASCAPPSYDGATLSLTCTVPQATTTETATETQTVTETATTPETATVTATATVTETVTPTPTPTPTPPTTTPPPPTSWPDATNTGVPAGTVLTVVNGGVTISTANTVVSGKDIRGCVEVKAPGVVIKNSLIACGNSTVVASYDGVYDGPGLTIQDSEIDCKRTGGSGIGDTKVTALRVNVHGCQHGFDTDEAFTIRDSYIHDLYQCGSCHTDGVTEAFGHYQMDANGVFTRPLVLLDESDNLLVQHNTFLDVTGGVFGTAAYMSNTSNGPAVDTNVLIDNNLMAGGAYTLYCFQGGTGSNYRVTNNHFSTMFKSTVGFYGISTDCGDETQSGNVIHETGASLFLQ